MSSPPLEALPADCISWLTSKGAIDRAGDALREETPGYQELRQLQCYRFFRLLSIGELVVLSGEAAHRSAIVSGRLKRIPSIMRKLLREPGMKLSRMTDLIGSRVIVESPDQANSVAESIDELEACKKIIPYSQNPRASGYRATHAFLRMPQKTGSGATISLDCEIQIKTYFQHLWSVVSESFGEQVKEGGGPKRIRDYLSALSLSIQEYEDRNPGKSQLPAMNEAGKPRIILLKRSPGSEQPHILDFGDSYEDAILRLLTWENAIGGDQADALLLLGDVDKAQFTHPTFAQTQLPLEDWMPRLPDAEEAVA